MEIGGTGVIKNEAGVVSLRLVCGQRDERLRWPALRSRSRPR